MSFLTGGVHHFVLRVWSYFLPYAEEISRVLFVFFFSIKVCPSGDWGLGMNYFKILRARSLKLKVLMISVRFFELMECTRKTRVRFLALLLQIFNNLIVSRKTSPKSFDLFAQVSARV